MSVKWRWACMCMLCRFKWPIRFFFNLSDTRTNFFFIDECCEGIKQLFYSKWHLSLINFNTREKHTQQLNFAYQQVGKQDSKRRCLSVISGKERSDVAKHDPHVISWFCIHLNYVLFSFFQSMLDSYWNIR